MDRIVILELGVKGIDILETKDLDVRIAYTADDGQYN